MQTFMQSLEYIIGGSRQPLYDTTKTNEIYNSLFDDDIIIVEGKLNDF